MVSDPGRLLCAHPIVHNIIGFQLQDSLALCVCRISRLNPFTRVIGERHLSPGSSRFVASPPAGFCSDVMVSLLSGWILPTRLCQLSWRTLQLLLQESFAYKKTSQRKISRSSIFMINDHFCRLSFGIVRSINSSNNGTVKATSPYVGL